MVQKSIEINQDQQEFLDEHPSINFSGKVREMLDKLMEDRGYENRESG
jgi:hypothetical protein